MLGKVITIINEPNAVLAIGTALGHLGVESLPFGVGDFINSAVAGSDAVAHSAREHDHVSENNKIKHRPLCV